MNENIQSLFNDWIDAISDPLEQDLGKHITHEDRKLWFHAFRAGFNMCEQMYDEKLHKFLDEKGI